MAPESENYGNQVRLIAGLRELGGGACSAFASQREFIIVTLNEMTADLACLKRAALGAAAGRFLGRLERGPVSQADITALKEALDKLVAAAEFSHICAGLAGSRGLLAERLARARPLCLAEQERSGRQEDPEAARAVDEAWRRLQFERLAGEAARFAGQAAEDSVLARARGRVAEHCALYRFPADPGDTLTPFSLGSIDAVAAACWRLLARLRRRGPA